MAAPLTAPSSEALSFQEQLALMREEIDRLQTIIALYIAPNYDIFSEDETEREALREAIKRRRERHAETNEKILDIEADVQDIKAEIAQIAHRHKPGEILRKRLERTEALLIARKNEPIPFSEMKFLQGFKPQYSRQDMTKLGHAYEQSPEKYEVRASKLGGKTVRLNPAYFNRLVKGGV